MVRTTNDNRIQLQHISQSVSSSISESLIELQHVSTSVSSSISQSLIRLEHLTASISSSILFEGIDDPSVDQIITFRVTVVSDG